MKILYLLVKDFSEVTVLLDSWVHAMFVHAHSSEASHVVVFFMGSVEVHVLFAFFHISHPSISTCIFPPTKFKTLGW